jgi:hypothetical protein
MSIISTGIAPNSSIIAQSGQQGSVGRADTASGINNSSIALGHTASAAKLASSSEARGASFGEGRQVDATFEKQGTDNNGLKDGKKEASGKGTLVNVEA